MRRLVALGALGALVCAGGLALLQSDLFAQRLRTLVIERGSQALGEDLHVQAVDLRLWPLTLVLTGVQVHSRDPLRPGQEILRVDALRVAGIRLRGLRTVHLDRVQLEQPVLRLRVGNGELRDFPGLRRAGGGGEPRFEVFLSALELADGSVSLSVDRPDLSLRMDGIQVRFASSAADESAATLEVADARVRIGGVEEQVVVESGTLVRRGDRLALERYRFVGQSADLTLDGELELSPTDASGAIVGNLRYDLDAVSSVELGEFSSRNPDVAPMEGRIDLHAVVRGTDGDVVVDGDLELTGGRVGKHVIGDADARVRYHDRLVEVERLWSGFGGGEITGSGAAVLGDVVTLSASLDLQQLQFAEVFEDLGMPPPWVMLEIDGHVEMEGTLDGGPRLIADVDLPCRDLRVYGGSWRERQGTEPVLALDGGTVEGTVHVLSDRTLLRDARVRTGASDLDLDVDFVYHKPLILDMRIDGRTLSLDEMQTISGVPFAGRGPATVHIHGLSKDLTIEGHAEVADFGMYGYALGRAAADVHWRARQDLVFSNVHAERGETAYVGDARLMFGKPFRFRAALDFDDGRVEDVVGIFTDVIDARGRFDGHIEVEGPVRELNGEAWVRGRDVWLLSERFTAVDTQVTLRDGRFTFRNAYLRKGRGGIYGRGYLDTHGPIDMELFTYAMDLDQVDLVRGWDLPLSADLDADVHLWGTVRKPYLHGQLSLSGSRYARASLGDSRADVTLREGVLRMEGSLLGRPSNRVSGRLDLGGSGDYDVDVALTALPLHLLFSPRTLARMPTHLHVDGTLAGQGRVGEGGWHEAALEISRFDLDRGETRLDNDGPIQLSLDGGRLRVERLRLVGERSDLSARGTVGPGGAVDLHAGGQLNLSLIDLLVPALGASEARRTDVTFDWTGERPAASLTASVAVEGGSVRTIHFPHPLEIDRARLELTDDRVRVESFEGMLGGGAIEGIVGSEIELVDGKPYTYDVHTRCVDCTVRYPSSLPWSRGTADLRLRGTVPMVVLEGDIVVDEMVYRDDFNWQSSIFSASGPSWERGGNVVAEDEEPGGVYFGLDLRIRGQGGFGLSNNLGQAQASGELRVIGDSRRVGLEGGLRTDGGQVWFRGHDFDLTEGTFTFPEPYALDPHFHLVIETEATTRDERYAIQYVIDGHLADVGGMQISGSSDPYLSEADINALLLFGVTADGLQGLGAGGDMAALVAQGANIGFGALMEQVREARGELGGDATRSALPDRVDLVPDYSTTGQLAGFSVVVGKDLIPNRLSGQASVGLQGNSYGLLLDWRVARNLHMVPSWYRRSQNTLGTLSPLGDVGDFSVDMRWVLEAD